MSVFDIFPPICFHQFEIADRPQWERPGPAQPAKCGWEVEMSLCKSRALLAKGPTGISTHCPPTMVVVMR